MTNEIADLDGGIVETAEDLAREPADDDAERDAADGGDDEPDQGIREDERCRSRPRATAAR